MTAAKTYREDMVVNDISSSIWALVTIQWQKRRVIPTSHLSKQLLLLKEVLQREVSIKFNSIRLICWTHFNEHDKQVWKP